MTPIRRDDVIDYVTYTEKRPEFRARIAPQKAVRRIHLGEYLTFLFENRDTILFQVQEMLRVERIVKEADIQHEIDTYNDILGGEGELGCTLLVEIDDPDIRDVLLRKWLDLPKHIYARLPDGSKARARYDAAQVGEDRISSVQFLKFDTKGATPVAFGVDHAALTMEVELRGDQRDALRADLAS